LEQQRDAIAAKAREISICGLFQAFSTFLKRTPGSTPASRSSANFFNTKFNLIINHESPSIRQTTL